jgi:hypothetical protein
MKISRTITIDFEDLIEIQKRIKNGEISSLSGFMQKAIQNELKRGD